MKWINYHHLIYFKDIARLGSISKASETLLVGQPALSSQLKSLEEYLGVKLFERKNRRLFLTEPGKVALEYANKISDLGQELVQVIDDKAFTNQIHLSVGALDSIPKSLISDIVDFAHKKTECFLSIYEDDIESLFRMLASHQIEVIISDHDIPTQKEKNIFSKRILKKSIGVYASPDFADLKKGFPKSLEGKPVILPTTHSRLRQDIDHFFHLHHVHPKRVAETQDTSLQKLLSSRGDGLIFLPDFTAKGLVKEGKLIKIGSLEKVSCEYYLIYSKRIISNPALELVLKQDFEKMRLGL